MKVIPDAASSNDAANRSTDMGVVVLPALQGLAAPHWRTDIRGAMFIANLAAYSALGIRLDELASRWQSEAVYSPGMTEELRERKLAQWHKAAGAVKVFHEE